MFDDFIRTAIENNIDIDRKKESKLREYWELLRFYNTSMHLFSKKDVELELSRQFYDILLLNVFLLEYDELIDAGAGAGFAGLILAILNEEKNFILVERSQKKASFLEMAALKLALKNVEIKKDDIESLEFNSDIVVSKASCMREILETNLMNYVRVGGLLIHFSAHKLLSPYKNYEFKNPFRDSIMYLSVLERVV